MPTDSNSYQRPSERSFGLSVGVACEVFSGLVWWRGHTHAFAVLSVIGGILVLAGITLPATLRIPNRLWWRFAQVLAWINASVILAGSFILVLTPVGCVLRLLGRSPLRAPKGQSTWSGYSGGHSGPKHYEHLF